MIFWNKTTDKKYALSEDALIVLPDSEPQTISEFGLSPGITMDLTSPRSVLKEVTINEQGDYVETETNLGLFSIYDYIGDTPTLLMNSTEDVLLTTTVEPYNVLDEIGEQFQIVTYTDDAGVSQGDVIVEANYSPLDELDGSITLLTLLGEAAENGVVAKVTAAPKPTVLIPTEDFKIPNVEYIIQVVTKHRLAGNGMVKMAVSFDNGFTYYGYTDGDFTPVELTVQSMRESAVSVLNVGAITREQWAAIRGTSNSIRFAYLLDAKETGDVAEIDQVDLTVELVGTWRAAVHGKDFDYEYSDTETLNVWLYSSGDFKINY